MERKLERAYGKRRDEGLDLDICPAVVLDYLVTPVRIVSTRRTTDVQETSRGNSVHEIGRSLRLNVVRVGRRLDDVAAGPRRRRRRRRTPRDRPRRRAVGPVVVDQQQAALLVEKALDVEALARCRLVGVGQAHQSLVERESVLGAESRAGPASLLRALQHSRVQPPPRHTHTRWWRGTVVERRSLAGELSLSCARPAADG